MPLVPPRISTGRELANRRGLSVSEGLVSFNNLTVRLDRESCKVLGALLQCAGEVVSETVLLSTLETPEGNGADVLWQIVASLNNALIALGPDVAYIEQFQGHGYLLKLRELTMPNTSIQNVTNAIIGREVPVGIVVQKLAQRRFVTIVGPGGIGKTTLMRTVCATLATKYPDGIRLLDLAPLSDGELVPATIAAALGMPISLLPIYAGLAAFLRGKRALIVLDSCEHLIAQTAIAAEALLRAAPGIHVLTTSREPLLADGEWQLRLMPMDFPDAEVEIDACKALTYSAVQLFVERARRASGPYSFEFDDSTSEIICDICRKLDGLPLAIELAAAWFRSFGPEQFVEKLNARLLGPTDRARNAETRHLNLASMLDWSYDLLPTHQQTLLRRIAVFSGSFTLDAAIEVAAFDGLGQDQAAESFLELIAKSFITANDDRGSQRHRLLDTTRTYCLDKLEVSAEACGVYHRHLVYLCELLEAAQTDWEHSARRDWLARYAPWVDDVRAALDRAFRRSGEKLLGIRLTVASCALGNQQSLMSEFSVRVDAALAALSQFSDLDPRWEVILRMYGVHAQLGRSLNVDQVIRPLERFLEIARVNGLPKYQTAPLCGLWATKVLVGDFPQATGIAERISAIGVECKEPNIYLIGQRMLAQSAQYMGWHNKAFECASFSLNESWRRIPLEYYSAALDISTSMRILKARLLWQMGSPDSAVLMGMEALRYAKEDVPVAMCQAIAMATLPIAIWRGDYAVAQEQLAMLYEWVERHGFVHWRVWADGYASSLVVLEGEKTEPKKMDEINATPPFTYQRDHMPTLSPSFWSDEILARVNEGKVGWCAPEVLRLSGERMLGCPSSGASAHAKNTFLRAIELARRQNALAWELRAATSLALLQRDLGLVDEARHALQPVLASFIEGLTTADYLKARAVLDSLT